jgi:hypothetical protein
MPQYQCSKDVLKLAASGFATRIVTQFGLLVLLVLPARASGQVESSGNFALFRTRIAQPASSFRLEFVEGDVHHDAATTIKHVSGSPVILQSQRRYHATYQRGGFLLSQVPETVAIEGATKLLLFVDCGRNEAQGWVRRDSAFVRLVDLDIVSTDPTVQTVVEEVKRRENMVCCACFYGLPSMDVLTIKWDGLQFYARAANGDAVSGRASIDPTNGLVSGATYATYDFHGKNSESGAVRYAYSNSKDVSSMPDIVEKSISQVAGPVGAARNSFSIKIIQREALLTVFDQKEFNPSSKGWHYMISNGIPLTRVAGKFVSKEEVYRVRRASQQGGGNAVSSSGRRAVVILVGISSLAILGWLARHQKQNAESKK